MNLKIYDSKVHDPYFNLAFEEYLVNSEMKEDELVLYFWQNDKTVVIGRNQNPYMECNIDYAGKKGINIARRLSGGGAVYHDMGNLNYTIVSCNTSFSQSANFSVLINALRSLGIDAVKTGRNDVEINGKKVSGTAFFHGMRNSYQHGCIIIDVNIENMENVLSVRKDKIWSKGIRSVSARVISLKEVIPSLNIVMVRDSILKSAIMLFRKQKQGNLELKDIGDEIVSDFVFRELMKKYQSEKWIFGRKIPMEYQLYRRFPWGSCHVNIDSDCNIIENISIYSDSLETNLFGCISNELRETPFKRNSMINRMKKLADCEKDKTRKAIVNDIAILIREELMIHDG